MNHFLFSIDNVSCSCDWQSPSVPYSVTAWKSLLTNLCLFLFPLLPFAVQCTRRKTTSLVKKSRKSSGEEIEESLRKNFVGREKRWLTRNEWWLITIIVMQIIRSRCTDVTTSGRSANATGHRKFTWVTITRRRIFIRIGAREQRASEARESWTMEDTFGSLKLVKECLERGERMIDVSEDFPMNNFVSLSQHDVRNRNEKGSSACKLIYESSWRRWKRLGIESQR